MHLKSYLFVIGLIGCLVMLTRAEDDDEQAGDEEHLDESAEEDEERDEEDRTIEDKKEDDDDSTQYIYGSVSKGPAKDFGKHIEWIEDIDEALEKAKEVNKPIMMVVHRTWCIPCKKLAPRFAASPGIAALHKHFVMLSLSGEQEPWQEEYQPDGKNYAPRVHFIEPDGKLIADIKNEDDSYAMHGYDYFFDKPKFIVRAMKKVLQRYKIPNLDDVDEDNEEEVLNEPARPSDSQEKKDDAEQGKDTPETEKDQEEDSEDDETEEEASREKTEL